MRNAFANAFYQIAKNDPRIYLVVADITAAAGVASFREEEPDRFINVGVAEQIMIGFAAGLALRGCIPFTYTIAPFTIYRPFEQVRVDCCYQDLPVRLVGVGAGVTYSTLGGTHHALEDLAVMGAIPNMTIFAPCDAAEATAATQATMDVPGPVYLRIGKVGEPDITSNAPDPYQRGKIRFLKNGQDVCIMAVGPIAKMGLDIAACLEREKGISAAVVSVHTVKPLDLEGIAQRVLSKFSKVITIEEHIPLGGLGQQVKALAHDSDAKCKVKSYTLQDKFIHVYGSHEEVQKAHGLDPRLIFQETLK